MRFSCLYFCRVLKYKIEIQRRNIPFALYSVFRVFCYSMGRIKLERFLNVVVKARIGKLKEKKSDYELGGHPYRNYVLK